MDKDIENRFKLIEECMEIQLVRHEKTINYLRAELEIFKAQFGQSDVLNKSIDNQQRPIMGIKNAMRRPSLPDTLEGWAARVIELKRLLHEAESIVRDLENEQLPRDVNPNDALTDPILEEDNAA